MPKVLSESDVTDFRDRACEAATRLFAEKGADGVTMRELASALGVSAMTPYRYFRDKDEILAAVRARAFNRFAECLERAWSGPGDVFQRAMAKRDAYVRFALDHPASYKLMFDLSQPTAANHPELMQAAERAKVQMSNHIRELVDLGLVSGDPELIGHAFWALLHGAVTLHLANQLSAPYKPGTQYGIERIVAEATQALGEGFRARTN
ncbi:MAG: TetR/AcrR family transcriptional regulator [Alphaproteobacteria bacterium]|nr:TetR/AcrR family transcriptional regulator [Alphaproteobacteria bacterium]